MGSVLIIMMGELRGLGKEQHEEGQKGMRIWSAANSNSQNVA